MRFIYDLDHTVICSAHRQATLPNGDLDLAHWIENSTAELVARDSLLPLAEHWKTQRARGAGAAQSRGAGAAGAGGGQRWRRRRRRRPRRRRPWRHRPGVSNRAGNG